MAAPPPTQQPSLRPARPTRAARTFNLHEAGWGALVKLFVMAVVDAFGVFVLMSAWNTEAWGVFSAMAAMLVAANWVYFTKRRTLPLKYILPGLLFLLAFQVYVMAYTGYVAFTNYGDGHNLTKEQAIASLMAQNERQVEGSSTYPLAVVADGDDLGLAIVDAQGQVLAGTSEQPLEAVPDAVVTAGRASEVPGFRVLTVQEIVQDQSAITSLRVPYSQDPAAGSIRTQDAMNGYVYRSTISFDAASDTLTDVATGTVYHATDRGQFESADGAVLTTGWRVVVGFENFTAAFSDSRYAGPFFKVLLWTFAFAFLSVATTFLLGLFLAAVLNDERIRGRKLYRTLLLIPYAFPAFLSALIWAGMLNTKFGFINQALLGGAEIPWLTDPWLARLAVIGVNLWLGFPYMFLVCTGALQSIPQDIKEAARVDGAGVLRTWRSVISPILLISTAPLLISSFAFNFNNFTLIYMLTGGGPRFTDTSAPIGATDILISMVYSISGVDGSSAKNYGLASALSIIIFVVVGTISAISFRQTRKLEEVL